LRRQLKQYIIEELGQDFLSGNQDQTELRKIKKEIAKLKKRLGVLKARKTELENQMKK
jgi:cell division protein FtsB